MLAHSNRVLEGEVPSGSTLRASYNWKQRTQHHQGLLPGPHSAAGARENEGGKEAPSLRIHKAPSIYKGVY